MKNNKEQLELLSRAKEHFGDALTLDPSLAEELSEYEKVKALPWDDAVDHCRQVWLLCISIGSGGVFGMYHCQNLLDRYKSGERSQVLFDSMMSLH